MNDNARCHCSMNMERACVYKKKKKKRRGKVYKEGSSRPRQGCQLAKAAQHECVRLGDGGGL